MRGRGRKAPRENSIKHTLVASGAEIRGDIVFSGALHVHGRIEGNISVGADGGQLVVGGGGAVKGEIRVPDIIINGRVEGDVHALGKLELAEEAVIEGNVYYNLIEMVVGAQVNGKLLRQGEPKHLPAPGKEADAALAAVGDTNT